MRLGCPSRKIQIVEKAPVVAFSAIPFMVGPAAAVQRPVESYRTGPAPSLMLMCGRAGGFDFFIMTSPDVGILEYMSKSGMYTRHWSVNNKAHSEECPMKPRHHLLEPVVAIRDGPFLTSGFLFQVWYSVEERN